MKTLDKHEICRKALSLLKKNYSTSALKQELPVLETMLYACCLENASPQEADQAYARLLNSFHDLNEIRVSSIYELERIFHDMQDPEWRALRVRSVLQYVFENTYSFDFESLRRKTHELAAKQLQKIKSLSPFVRSFALQNSLGSHILPLDERLHTALIWLGLAEPESTAEHAAETLRPFVRKADGQLFCYLLRCLATDRKYAAVFQTAPNKSAASDGMLSGYERLEHLIRHGPPRKRETAKRGEGAKGGNGARKSDVKKAAKTTKDAHAKGTSKKAGMAKSASRPAPKKHK